MTTPTSAISLRSSRQRACWSWLSEATASSIRAICWRGVRPSWLIVSTPSRSWPLRPATRTMKNSSRLFAEIDRKRSRSSSGWLGFSASSSTRRLKPSQDSSRLTKRSELDSQLSNSSSLTPASGSAATASGSSSG